MKKCSLIIVVILSVLSSSGQQKISIPAGLDKNSTVKWKDRDKMDKDSVLSSERSAQQLQNQQKVIVAQKTADSIAYLDRIRGFYFVNKEYALFREKPAISSKVIGRIYAGSYVKVLGYSEGSTFIKVKLEDIIGYIDQAELVDDLDKLTTGRSELGVYKSRQYYKFIPNYDYAPEKEIPYSVPVRSSYTSPNEKSTPKKQNYSTSRNYIRGPRGGCYYISTNNTKVYVDRGLCQ